MKALKLQLAFLFIMCCFHTWTDCCEILLTNWNCIAISDWISAWVSPVISLGGSEAKYSNYFLWTAKHHLQSCICTVLLSKNVSWCVSYITCFEIQWQMIKTQLCNWFFCIIMCEISWIAYEPCWHICTCKIEAEILHLCFIMSCHIHIKVDW